MDYDWVFNLNIVFFRWVFLFIVKLLLIVGICNLNKLEMIWMNVVVRFYIGKCYDFIVFVNFMG